MKSCADCLCRPGRRPHKEKLETSLGKKFMAAQNPTDIKIGIS